MARPVPDAAVGAPRLRAGLVAERHPRLVRGVTVLALAWGGAYLAYRLAATGRGVDPPLFVALVLVEGYNLASLAFLAFFAWRIEAPPRPAATPDRWVDVFVTTYDEPVSVVEATLAGCAALRYPHETYLLDDGRRPEMRDLARRWGAHWVVRPDHRDAKAGNINHALEVTAGELIFCLDADHVPLPDALDALVGYFDDEDVALVQSPHDFYNFDSVQHYEAGRHEQSLFFRVICPGKDRHGGVFWCGSAALIRRRALLEAGGVSTETIAEDFHTTIKMQRLGWRTRFHDEVLVQGLAPLDLDGYLLQRDRWARGNLSVLRLPESPLAPGAGLTPLQRLSYLGNLFAYGAGAAQLVLIALVAVVLVTGILPAHLGLSGLLVLWAPSTFFAVCASIGLSRGHLGLRESSHYTLITAEVFTRALRCAFIRSHARFRVTPKRGADTAGLRSLGRVRVLCAFAVALAFALAWRALGLAGALHERPLPPLAAALALGLGVWELARMLRSLRIVARRQQRREAVRFPCTATGALRGADGERSMCRVLDVAVGGVGLLLGAAVPEGTVLELRTTLTGPLGEPLPVAATLAVVSSRTAPGGGFRIGTAISAIDADSHDNLVRYCYVAEPYARLRAARSGAAPLHQLADGARRAQAALELASRLGEERFGAVGEPGRERVTS